MIKTTKAKKAVQGTLLAGAVLFGSFIGLNEVQAEKGDVSTLSNSELVNEFVSKHNVKLSFEQVKEIEKFKKLQAIKDEVHIVSSESVKATSKKQQVFNVKATFYTSRCAGCSGITASGINVRNTIYYKGMRVIAVDPRYIPLGSIVRVDMKGQSFTAIAADKGGAIKGANRIDVLVKTKAEAYRLGVQKNVKVTVLKYGV